MGGEHIETYDAVFGDIIDEGPNYRNVWLRLHSKLSRNLTIH